MLIRARKPIEIVNDVEAVQDGPISIEQGQRAVPRSGRPGCRLPRRIERAVALA